MRLNQPALCFSFRPFYILIILLCYLWRIRVHTVYRKQMFTERIIKRTVLFKDDFWSLKIVLYHHIYHNSHFTPVKTLCKGLLTMISCNSCYLLTYLGNAITFKIFHYYLWFVMETIVLISTLMQTLSSTTALITFSAAKRDNRELS